MFGSMPLGLRRRPNPEAIQSFLASVNNNNNRRNSTAASAEKVDTVVVSRADNEVVVNFPASGTGNVPLDGTVHQV